MLRTSCFVGVEMTLGDLICQSLEGATSFDTGRSAAVGAAGFTATAPVVHMCLLGLERTLPGNSASAVLGKVRIAPWLTTDTRTPVSDANGHRR